MKKIYLFLAFFPLAAAMAQPQQTQYNVLWLVAEDLSPHFGCYGDKTVPTPHVDRLSREGITFDKAYSVVGVCAPSRSSIITGMYPTSIGSHNMRIGPGNQYKTVPNYQVVPPADVRCFSEYLRMKGVYCINAPKTDYQFVPPVTAWDEQEKKSLRHQDMEKWGEFPQQRPFFKVINFWQTHESQVWAQMRKEIPLQVDTAKVQLPPYLPNTPVMKMDVAYHYNNVHEMDKLIGVILKRLEEDGLLDKTIIFFYSDHGDGLPRMKRTVYESGVRVPLIVRFPDRRGAGTRRKDMVSLMDMGPTVLSHFQVPIPSYMHGRDIFKKGQAPRPYLYYFADRFDDDTDMIRAVTNGRFKYIRYYQPHKPQFLDLEYRKQQAGVVEFYRLAKEGKLNKVQQQVMRPFKPVEELFDTQNDPHEIRDLAGMKEHDAVLKELRTALDTWVRETRDMGFTPEKELALRFWPEGIQPTTALPEVDMKDGTVSVSCKTPGASLGYRVGRNKPWAIYQGPFKTEKGDTLYVNAHRIGFSPSLVKIPLGAR